MTAEKKMFLMNILRIKGFEAFERETESMDFLAIKEVLKCFLERGFDFSCVKGGYSNKYLRTKIYMALTKAEYRAERKLHDRKQPPPFTSTFSTQTCVHGSAGAGYVCCLRHAKRQSDGKE